jgi:hypothetical protein
MLSIRFDRTHEWFVSGSIFDRLFDAAVRDEHVPARLGEWKLVAAANGGLGFHLIDPPEDAAALADGLRAAARAELARLPAAPRSHDDESYHLALERLLALGA